MLHDSVFPRYVIGKKRKYMVFILSYKYPLLYAYHIS